MASHAPRTASKFWVFTQNNPMYHEWCQEQLEPHVQYLVYQGEIGENGTEHTQGYFVLAKPERLSKLKKWLPEAHFEIRKGTHEQAKAYCKKNETREFGPVEIGDDSKVPKGSGARSDLIEIRNKLDSSMPMSEIMHNHFGSWCRYRQSFNVYQAAKATPRNTAPVVHILWGVSGGGKTHKANELAPNAFVLTRPDHGTLWFDGYITGQNLIIDEFYGWIKYDLFLRILDKYALQVPVKGGFAIFNSPIICITSNADPMTWYSKVDDRQALHRRFRDFCKIEHFEREFSSEEWNFAAPQNE